MFILKQLKHTWLRVMVWNMRWMTRYFGFIARPFIAWYGNQEVIACGLKNRQGQVCIIYSPMPNRHQHTFHKKQAGQWIDTQTEKVSNFSGELVHQVALTEPLLNQINIVRAKKVKSGKTMRSPSITIKPTTDYPELIDHKPLDDGGLNLNWKTAEKYNVMIYFLAIEDENGQALSGVYTRENSWTYPKLKSASYSIGSNNPPKLEQGKKYTAKLLVVDFDGWVPAIGEKTFVY